MRFVDGRLLEGDFVVASLDLGNPHTSSSSIRLRFLDLDGALHSADPRFALKDVKVRRNQLRAVGLSSLRHADLVSHSLCAGRVRAEGRMPGPSGDAGRGQISKPPGGL